MTLRLAALAQGRALRPCERLRVASLAQGRALRPCERLAALAQGRARLLFAAALTAAFMVTGGGTSVLACPMCFGAEETAMIDGTRLGILAMLGITIAVQAAFVAFFIYLRRRAKQAADTELDAEWAELQRPSRT